MGLFVVMPLWLVYEVLRVAYVPGQMNRAEFYAKETFQYLPVVVVNAFRVLMAVSVFLAARSIFKQHIPWLRVGLVVVLEGAVYGLMLGPVVSQLTRHSLLAATLQSGETLLADLIGSLGAGIYEEFLFRLVLLSLFGWLFFRVTETFSLPKWLGAAFAVLVSALLFSLFHYDPQTPEALEPRVFVFRAIAGVLFGVLFMLRGFGVCVYTHAIYDVLFYLDHR